MRIALTIDRLQGDPRCFQFAYRALRMGWSDPSVHLGYMMGLVFTGKSQKLAFTAPTEVEPDTVVLMTEKDGGRKLVRILETDPDPKIERDEITPDVELGPILLRRKVGEEIEIPSISGRPTVYVIREIRNKYLHAHYRSLEQFETLFPGNPGFGAISIDESKGDSKFKPIFNSAKRRSEFIADLAERYRQGQLPLMMLSRFAGHSPCDTWDWVVAQPDLGMRACVGSQEFSNASNLLATSRKAVIDPITLYGLVQLGIVDKVRACFEDLGVVQTTIDLFRRHLEERKKELGTDHGTLGWNGQNYQIVKYDDAFTLQRIQQAQAALTFAEELTLLSATPTVVFADERRQIFEDLDPSFLDTIYAAEGDSRLLYSDEYMFRRLGFELNGVGGVWTQIAAINANHARYISNLDYYEIVSKLVIHNYRFTTIDFRSILHQLKKDNWQITPALEAFATHIAAPTNDQDSVIRLLSNLAQIGWHEKPDRASYVRLFTKLIAAGRQASPLRDAVAHIGLVRNMVRALCRLGAYRLLLKRRLDACTYLTPVSTIVDRVNVQADVVFLSIDEALSLAFADAVGSAELSYREKLTHRGGAQNVADRHYSYIPFCSVGDIGKSVFEHNLDCTPFAWV